MLFVFHRLTYMGNANRTIVGDNLLLIRNGSTCPQSLTVCSRIGIKQHLQGILTHGRKISECTGVLQMYL